MVCEKIVEYVCLRSQHTSKKPTHTNKKIKILMRIKFEVSRAHADENTNKNEIRLAYLKASLCVSPIESIS